MSENFEEGLHDLYVRAALAHTRGVGLPTTAMKARARRNRRVRAAGMSVATVAAVAVVAVGGSAALGTFGQGNGAAPAGTTGPTEPTPTLTAPATADPTTATATPAPDMLSLCGQAVSKVGDQHAAAVDVSLARDVVRVGEDLSGRIDVKADPATVPELGEGVRLVLASSGGVVAVSEVSVTANEVTRDGTTGTGTSTGEIAAPLTSCGDSPDGHVPEGAYDVYVLVPAADAAGGTALGGPVRLTIAASNDGTFPTAPDTQLTDGHSALFKEGAALPDGDYVGYIRGVESTGRTIDVDLAVYYVGQAAYDYVAAHPGGTVVGDAYVANEVSTTTSLPLSKGASFWDPCVADNENLTTESYQRTLAEWMAASDPTGAPLARCTDATRLPRASFYWFQVRSGVVMDVIGRDAL